MRSITAVWRYLRGTARRQARRHSLVGPAHLWEMKRAFQIEFLQRQGLRPHHYLFDVGCGTLRGGVPLIRYLDPGHYFGFDVSADRLEEGQNELLEAKLLGKEPVLFQAPRIADLGVTREYDFIWAFSVLIHMADDIVAETFQFVSNHLTADGVFYANVNIGDRKDHSWREFPVVTRPLGFYREICFSNGLKLTDLGRLDELGHVSGSASQDAQRMLKIVRG